MPEPPAAPGEPDAPPPAPEPERGEPAAVACGTVTPDGAADGTEDPSGRSDALGPLEVVGRGLGVDAGSTRSVGPARLGLGPLAGVAENCVAQLPAGSRALAVHVPSSAVPPVSDSAMVRPATDTETVSATTPVALR